MRWEDEPIAAKRPTWRGITFDSQLEADWASTFTAWGMEFVYHPGRLYLSDCVYEPDFQLDGDVLFEAKGPADDRIQKAFQAERETGLPVIIGRSGWLPAGSDIECAGAVWESEDWAIDTTHGAPMFVRHNNEVDFMYTAYYAFARNLSGARFYKAYQDACV